MGMMWFIWIPLVLIAFWFLPRLVNDKSSIGSSEETPMDILKKRYANGEITKEEYEERKKVLEE